MFESRFSKWLLALWLIYLISPIDFLPDYLGWLGRIDDLLLLGYVLYKLKHEGGAASTTHGSRAQERSRPSEAGGPVDPFQLLELDRSASWEDVERSYRRLAAQYHPDKVNHLGKDLQKLAHEKMIAIQEAYGELRKRMGK